MKLFLTASALLAIAFIGSLSLRDARPAAVITFSAPVSVPQLAVAPAPPAESLPKAQTLQDLATAWKEARNLDQLDPIAQSLAEMNTPESVQKLLDGIEHIKEWPVRAALAKNLRAVSNPETLQVLLPALLNNYGRGNTILNEISDTIARLAQPETVEDLAALHWQASTQAGQGHKVLRTVASIRNPIAARGLMKVANFSESPALAAAAQEALKVIDQPVNNNL
jgi:hypothetical protein